MGREAWAVKLRFGRVGWIAMPLVVTVTLRKALVRDGVVAPRVGMARSRLVASDASSLGMRFMVTGGLAFVAADGASFGFGGLGFAAAADGFDFSWAAFGFEPDGAALVAEGFAELAGEVFFILVGDELGVVDEEAERGWGFIGLGGVEEFEVESALACGRFTGDGFLEGPVDDGGGDLELELAGDVADGFEHTVEVEAGLCGGEDDWGVVEEEEDFLHPVGEVGEGHARAVTELLLFIDLGFSPGFRLGFLDGGLEEVPFIDDDDAGFFGVHDDVGNFLVLFEDAGFGIEHEHDEVAAADGFLGTFDAEELDGVIDAASFPHAGGIDEEVALAGAVGFDFEGDID
ncbi:MAG: hypothetical protein RI897_2966 [Verrucomicrobiota bacterium]